MLWTRTKPVAYPINSSSSAQNLGDLDAFFAKMVSKDGGSDFMSDLTVLKDGEHKFVVVREKKGGPIAAYALLRQSGTDAEVEMLFSMELGVGYGQLALSTAEIVAKQHGAKQVWLDSVSDAESFYRHMGYTDSGNGRFVKVLKA